MTTLAHHITQCPNCACKFRTWGYASSNTFGAKKIYTDGFQKWSVFNTNSAVLFCPDCNFLLWQDELPSQEFISERDDNFFDSFSLPETRAVQLSDYEAILQQVSWRTDAQEKRIRIRLWWTYNNAYRNRDVETAKEFRKRKAMCQKRTRLFDTKKDGPVNQIESRFHKQILQLINDNLLELARIKAWFSFNYSVRDCSNKRFTLSSKQAENLRRLLQLLDTKEPSGLIMRAEILRELGLFDKCLKQLDTTIDERYLSAVTSIRELASRKIRRVTLI